MSQQSEVDNILDHVGQYMEPGDLPNVAGVWVNESSDADDLLAATIQGYADKLVADMAANMTTLFGIKTTKPECLGTLSAGGLGSVTGGLSGLLGSIYSGLDTVSREMIGLDDPVPKMPTTISQTRSLNSRLLGYGMTVMKEARGIVAGPVG